MGADAVPPPSEGQPVTSHLMRNRGELMGAIKMLLASHYNNTLTQYTQIQCRLKLHTALHYIRCARNIEC